MPRNSIGHRLVLSSFGESHGPLIGAMLDGCPAGLEISESDIQPMLDMRKPGQSAITTQRKESDTVRIVTGIYRGRTTGAPIMMTMENTDQRSGDYDNIRQQIRPGHSDYTAMIKYGKYNDHRGGGRFSGRLTATHVMGGAIARKLLKTQLGITTCSFAQQIGKVTMPHIPRYSSGMQPHYSDTAIYSNDVRCPDKDTAGKMKEAILDAKRSGDSLGGIIYSITSGVPAGLGEPMFGSLESDISAAIFSIPSVKGVEFGSGFAGSETRGSENNDIFETTNDTPKKVITRTNNSGGILGGISNAMPITMRVAFKPVSSISRQQQTIDATTHEPYTLNIVGRHDPCIVPRAPPVVDALVSLILADHAITSGHIGQVIV